MVDMWKTSQKFEETVTVINEQTPIRGSGGIAVISDNTSQQVKMVMLPDITIHSEPRKGGQYSYERLYAQVSKDEIDDVDIIPGKTRVVWNGLEYRVVHIIDYTSKLLFRNVEIEMRRNIGNI